MTARRTVTLAAAVLLAAASPRSGEAAKAKNAPVDSAAAQASWKPAPRASWLSDRVVLRPGDLITVVVDEQTAARERVSRTATGDRTLSAGLRTQLGDSNKNYTINSELGNDSRDVGEANRQGDLTAVLTVRVKSVAENGVAQIEGEKHVNVDGRVQDITLKGAIRLQDVSPANTVLSNAIADVMITYKGKTIGPRVGIIGKFLGMLWP